MMPTYRIQAKKIDATVEGDDEQDALENYAQDSGYNSYKDLESQHGGIDSIEEVEDNE